MKTALSTLLVMGIIACQCTSQQSRKPIAEVGDTVQRDSPRVLHHSDCVRGEPAPVVDKAIFPNTSFYLEDSTTGIETIKLLNEDSITITNWGCEYYCLTFRIETSRFSADTSDIRYWVDKAITCMTELKKGLRPPPDYTPALDTLRVHASNNMVQLRDDIYYDNNDIPEKVSLDGIHQLSNGRYSMELTFAIGPL